jgi:hypothetical protein
MTDCSCGTCNCQETIQRLERQQLENLQTIANLEMQLSDLQKPKKHMFPEKPPSLDTLEEECVACSA